MSDDHRVLLPPTVLLVHCNPSSIDSTIAWVRVASNASSAAYVSRLPIFASDPNIVDEFAGCAQQAMADGICSIGGPMLPRATRFP
jgi:hypothetical protein